MENEKENASKNESEIELRRKLIAFFWISEVGSGFLMKSMTVFFYVAAESATLIVSEIKSERRSDICGFLDDQVLETC